MPVASERTWLPNVEAVYDGEAKPAASRTRSPNSIVCVPCELMKSASTVVLTACWKKRTPPSFVVIEETTSFAFA